MIASDGNLLPLPGEGEVTTRSSVERLLAQRSLGLVGASRSGKKFGNTILRELQRKGYRMFVVHPEASEIDGTRCYGSVSDLPDEIGGLVIVVPPEQAEKVVREAVDAGVRNIWMQQGSESDDAIGICGEHGINVIHGECILMFAQPGGVHRLHRWIWGLLGKLPEGLGAS